jgi:hypothetical protein
MRFLGRNNRINRALLTVGLSTLFIISSSEIPVIVTTTASSSRGHTIVEKRGEVIQEGSGRSLLQTDWLLKNVCHQINIHLSQRKEMKIPHPRVQRLKRYSLQLVPRIMRNGKRRLWVLSGGRWDGSRLCYMPKSLQAPTTVCESNNPLCRHIFHKDCMVDWLTKLHDDCPTCREVYLLQATV